jgi:integrase
MWFLNSVGEFETMADPTRIHDPVRLTKRPVDAAKPTDREYVIWDTDIRGFGLKVIPPNGAGRPRKVYLLKYRTKARQARKLSIGVHGDITADQARQIAGDWKAEIAQGGDPKAKRDEKRATLAADSLFGEVVDDFVEKYAKVRQRTWRETERTLKTNCAAWLDKPISSITKADAYDLLDGFIAEGKGHKARVTHAWLRTLWRWAWKRDIVAAPVMDAVEIEFEDRVRDRHYSEEEIKAVWKGAGQLAPFEAGFVKLVILLGVRKGELAGMRRSEFDDPGNPTVWTVPHDRTKSRKKATKKRVYVVPLPPLAQRIIKSLPRMDGDLVFPGRHKEKPMEPGKWLTSKVREKSKVVDWSYHPNRDTLATWLEDQGHSEYERALVLNHAGGGTVTSRYSHGHATELKLELLEKWAEHVTELVQPEGAALLT